VELCSTNARRLHPQDAQVEQSSTKVDIQSIRKTLAAAPSTLFLVGFPLFIDFFLFKQFLRLFVTLSR